MTIKKIIWIVVCLLILIILAFSFPSIKKHYALKQIKDIHTEEKQASTEKEDNEDDEMEPEEPEEPEENNDTAAAPASAEEDPVRAYVHKAMKRLFKKDIQIVAIGDSLTQGVGDETENQGYVGILRDTINQDRELAEIDNYGKRGNRTDQMLERMKQPEIEAALNDADIILITIGANDIMQIFKENFTDLQLDQFTDEKVNYENRLHEIFSSMEQENPKADIYLIGFYNPFKQYFEDIDELEDIVNSWNALGENITKEYDQVTYIPTKDLFDDISIDYLSEDNFHPNHLGYELMAERVLESIVKEGESDEKEE